MREASSVLVKVLSTLALSLLQPFGAVGGTITFMDLGETGATISSTSDLVGRVTFVCGTPESCVVTVLAPGPGYTPGGGPGRINVFELNAPSVVSDTMLFSGNNTITFASDIEGIPLTPLTGAQSVIEDSSPKNLAVLQWTLAGSPTVNDQIAIASDVEPQTPEPSTILLILGGFALLGIRTSLRRTKRGEPSSAV